MKLKGINSSSKRTIELIKETFAELMEEKKEIKNITVTELVKRANLTRGAFYSHYDNIYEVASDFEEETLNQVFNNEMTISSQKELDDYLDKIFNYLENNYDIYSKLLNADETIYFMKRLNKKIYNSLARNSNVKNYLNVIFFTDGTIDLIVKSFRGEIKEDLKEISAYVKNMANYIFFSNN